MIIRRVDQPGDFVTNQLRISVEVFGDAIQKLAWSPADLSALLAFDWEASMAAQAEEMRLTGLYGPRLGPGRNELAAVRRRLWRVEQLRSDLARWGRPAGLYMRCPPRRRAVRRSRW